MEYESNSFNEDLYYAYINEKKVVIFCPVPYMNGKGSKEIIGKIIGLNILGNYCRVRTNSGYRISFDTRYIARIEIYD